MTAAPERSHSPSASRPLRIAGWDVDASAGRLKRDGQEVRLEPKAMEVLAYLAERPGEVVSREELEAAVWAPAVVGYDAVTTTMLKLRKAFGDDPKNPRIIETVSKRGYRLIAPVAVGEGPVTAIATPGESFIARIASWRGAALTLLLLGATATTLWFTPWHGRVRDDSTRRVSIAVLPFSNVGADPEQAYFADGITDDLITDLTKISGLFVISRDSVFLYKDEPVDAATIAEKLGVRYLLHGTVRRVGDHVRINVQLTDAGTDNQLWAERYDGNMGNIFELQDRIRQQIVSSLAVTLTDAERQHLARRDTDNLAAYDAFLRGEERFYRYARATNREARALFQKAIGLDPEFARAYAMLGWTHAFDFMNGWSDTPKRSLALGEQFASQAIELNAALPVAYFVRGLVHRERGDYVKAMVEAQNAVRLDPSYANGHVLYATLLYYAGRPGQGLEEMQRAIALNPHHPHNYPFHLGQAYFVLKRYPEAIAAFREGLASNPLSERLHVWAAAAYAQSGDIDQARWELDQARLQNPDVSLDRFRQAFPFKDPADLENFLEGLRKAGLP